MFWFIRLWNSRLWAHPKVEKQFLGGWEGSGRRRRTRTRGGGGGGGGVG